MWPVPGFRNHLIFYRVTGDAIEVLRVLHAARDVRKLLEEC
jgi:toxin ParE1/3/4